MSRNAKALKNDLPAAEAEEDRLPSARSENLGEDGTASTDEPNHLEPVTPASTEQPEIMPPVGNATVHPQANQYPEDLLLIQQLLRATPVHPDTSDEPFYVGSVELYRGLRPSNAGQSMIARTIVAVSCGTMLDFAHAALCSTSFRARTFNVQNGLKGADCLLRLVERYQAMQQEAKPLTSIDTLNNVMVGNVTVEPGGNAIVGQATVDRRKVNKGKGRRKARPGKKNAKRP
jgi:hypothetical protein